MFITALEAGRLVTVALDARSGVELWRQAAPPSPLEKAHAFSSPAASTPCTDGRRVYVYFGSFGVLAYDFGGKEVWKRTFETLPTEYGTASSPILAGGNLVLQRDGDTTNAQLVAMSPDTGSIRWESARSLAGGAYSTPMVWKHDGVEELIVQGKGRVSAYGLSGGDARWWVRGWGLSAVTTPVAGDGLLFAGGAGLGDPAESLDPVLDWGRRLAAHDANRDHRLGIDEIPEALGWQIRKEVPRDTPGNFLLLRKMLGWMDTNSDGVVTKLEWEAELASVSDKFNADRFVAIGPGAEKDGTGTHVVWETTRGLPEMPSPLFYRGRIYFIRDGGLLTVLSPRTGKPLVDRERVGSVGQVIASPVAANGYVYLANEPGVVTVLRAGDTLEVLARNRVEAGVRSTPALAGDTLYLRTAKHVWAFADRSNAR